MLKITVGTEEYTPWSGAVETWDKIQENNMTDEFEALLEELYPDGLTMTQVNDILWFEEDWIFESLGISYEQEA